MNVPAPGLDFECLTPKPGTSGGQVRASLGVSLGEPHWAAAVVSPSFPRRQLDFHAEWVCEAGSRPGDAWHGREFLFCNQTSCLTPGVSRRRSRSGAVGLEVTEGQRWAVEGQSRSPRARTGRVVRGNLGPGHSDQTCPADGCWGGSCGRAEEQNHSPDTQRTTGRPPPRAQDLGPGESPPGRAWLSSGGPLPCRLLLKWPWAVLEEFQNHMGTFKCHIS